jgi:radical SAM protein with 4Fe4S-binding SPASM domain
MEPFLSEGEMNIMTEAFFKLEHIDIEINHRCNLACKHCSAVAGKTSDSVAELSIEEIEDILGKAGKKGLHKVGLTGGEPFIDIPKIKEVIRYCRQELGVSLHTHTNGTLITEELCKDQDLIPHFDAISVTFLGGDSKTHEHMTDTPGSFDKSFEGARLLNKFGFPLTSYFIPTSGMCRSYKELAFKLRENGMKKIRAMSLAPSGRARPIYGKTAPDKKEMDKFELDLLDLRNQYGMEIEAGYCTRLSMPRLSVLSGHERCTSAQNRVHINSLGDIFPCTAASGVKELSVGTCKGDGAKLNYIWENSELLRRIRLQRTGKIEFCKSCPQKDQCLYGCMVNTIGTMSEKEKASCPIANLEIEI